ncbi:MAG: hypothetical protein HYW70_00875 [Candidatus Nealsonbacteria bacterium]|nr:hypothetical protein [Candidatus Nealsonbacteria bacterium]
MSLFDKREQVSRGIPKRSSSPSDENLFKRKEGLKRGEFREITKKAYDDPWAKKLGGAEKRVALEKLFPYQRFGSNISEQDSKKLLREMRSKEYRTSGAEKSQLKLQRKSLESLFKMKGKY